MKQTSCDYCSNFVYDDEYEAYQCMVNLDEDEAVRLMCDANYSCPYFQMDDEYKIVRKQM